MTCVPYQGSFICCASVFRLRLFDGTYVFMDFHHYCGPTFYKDRLCTREIEEWWEDPRLCRAFDWFVKRGHKA